MAADKIFLGCLISHLAACVAKEYFFETLILLILRSKINKISVSKDFILLPQAEES